MPGTARGARRAPTSARWSWSPVPDHCPATAAARGSPAPRWRRRIRARFLRTDAVDAGDIAEILDRARAQQRAPGMRTRRGPVGDVDQQVVIETALRVMTIARIHRKAQVVADQRTDFPATPFHDQPIAARRIALVLVGIAEQMPLVVVAHFAVGRDEQQAVIHFD